MNKKEFDQVVGLACFLERYTAQATPCRDKTFSFSKEDQLIWKGYFETLIKPGILPDGMAFGKPDNNCPDGIGTDGAAFSDEFFQLLMQCYKYLYKALSCGEIFLEHDGWYVTDRKGTR